MGEYAACNVKAYISKRRSPRLNKGLVELVAQGVCCKHYQRVYHASVDLRIDISPIKGPEQQQAEYKVFGDMAQFADNAVYGLDAFSSYSRHKQIEYRH